MAKITVVLIRFYQYFSQSLIRYNMLPLLFPSQCRYYPTCSEYAIESLSEYGFWKGSFKGMIRILKCSPLANH